MENVELDSSPALKACRLCKVWERNTLENKLFLYRQDIEPNRRARSGAFILSIRSIRIDRLAPSGTQTPSQAPENGR
jgi:hypothetical protein